MANRRYPRINRVNLGDDPDKHLADGITSLIADLHVEQSELAQMPELVSSDSGAASPLDRNEWDPPEEAKPVIVNVTFTVHRDLDEAPDGNNNNNNNNPVLSCTLFSQGDFKRRPQRLPMPCGLEYSLGRGGSSFLETTRLDAVTPRAVADLRLPPIKEITRGTADRRTKSRNKATESGECPMTLPPIETPGRPKRVAKKKTDKRPRSSSKSQKR